MPATMEHHIALASDENLVLQASGVEDGMPVILAPKADPAQKNQLWKFVVCGELFEHC